MKHNEYNNISGFTNPGSELENVYKKKYDSTAGTWKVYIDETINTYDKIQEASVGTTLQEMIAKYGGETEYLNEINQQELSYLDTTTIPADTITRINLKNDIEEKIRKLNNEIEKEKEKLETKQEPKKEINNEQK